MQTFAKVNVCGNRVRTIQIQGQKLPSGISDQVWSLNGLLEALKFYPNVEFRRWVREYRVYTRWLPLNRLPEKLLELVRPR